MKQQYNLILFLIVFCAFLFSSCKNQSEKTLAPSQEEGHAEEEAHEDENIATLTKEQMEAIGITIDRIQEKEITNVIKANGVLTVPNQNKAFITPLFSGTIKTLSVQPGAYIAKGQIVATIQNPDLIPMQQQLQQVNAQIALADIEVKRQNELVQGNAAPLKKLQQAKTELNVLRSQRAGLQKQLSGLGASQGYSSNITVRSPISGTVSQVSAQIGSSVNPSMPIAEVVNNSQLHLDLNVFEKDLPNIKVGQTIHFTLTNNPSREYDATVFSIGSSFENESKSVAVHCRVTGNTTGLIDGMNVTGVVSLNNVTAPAVPNEAIVEADGKFYIFVVTDKNPENHEEEEAREPGSDEHDHSKEESEAGQHATDKKTTSFEKIEVIKGASNMGFTAVTFVKQVPSDAKIVTKGAFFINAKLTNTGGHSH